MVKRKRTIGCRYLLYFLNSLIFVYLEKSMITFHYRIEWFIKWYVAKVVVSMLFLYLKPQKRTVEHTSKHIDYSCDLMFHTSLYTCVCKLRIQAHSCGQIAYRKRRKLIYFLASLLQLLLLSGNQYN